MVRLRFSKPQKHCQAKILAPSVVRKFLIHSRNPLNSKTRFDIMNAMTAKQQAIENLLTWAKTCVEEERARVGFEPGDETLVPSWLPELESAIEQLESAE